MKRTLAPLALVVSLCGAVAPTLVTVASASSVSAEDRGAQIAAEIDQRGTGYGDMTSSVTMQLENAHGQKSSRALRLRTLERSSGGDYSLVLFDSPSDVKGTALLSHPKADGDDQWLYLPALKRTRRISSKNTSGPFMGSEFAYEDITGAEVDKFSWTLLAEEACGKLTCFKLESRPKYDRSGYTKRVVWVDSAEYRVHKIDFYDRKDALLKTLTYGDYRQYQGKHWRSHVWAMKNHQSGKNTVLSFSDYKFGNGYTEQDFSKSALESIR